MLIPMQALYHQFNVRPKGVLHLGGHVGEEMADYFRVGIAKGVWFEANRGVMAQLEAALAPYPGHRAVNACVADVDDREVTLNIASNGASSSILRMKEHLRFYPTITEVAAVPMRTVTVDTWLARNDVPPDFADFANLDLQGSELLALKGMRTVLPHLKWIYAEINHAELYENCARDHQIDEFLAEHGFEGEAIAETICGWSDALYIRR